jgi:hypothetical protein
MNPWWLGRYERSAAAMRATLRVTQTAAQRGPRLTLIFKFPSRDLCSVMSSYACVGFYYLTTGSFYLTTGCLRLSLWSADRTLTPGCPHSEARLAEQSGLETSHEPP